MSPQHNPPGYWMHEESGVLRPVVEAYLTANPLTFPQIAIMRLYLAQWIDSPAWDMNPAHDERSRAALARLRLKVRAIHSVKDIREWLGEALQEGYDPL